jgi:predicted amidohydrolase
MRFLVVSFLFCCVACERFAFSLLGPQKTINATLSRFRDDFSAADSAGASFLLFAEFSIFFPGDLSRESVMSTCKDSSEVTALLGSTLMNRTSLKYAMVNFCEVDGSALYNVNFVLSSATGKVVAKYRKTHPWFKHIFDAPQKPDLIVFNGFGMFMCYDILFDTPSVVLRKQGVSKFLYNAAIPIVGKEVFTTWSLLHNATLIAADLNDSGAYVNGKRVGEKKANLILADV